MRIAPGLVEAPRTLRFTPKKPSKASLRQERQRDVVLGMSDVAGKSLCSECRRQIEIIEPVLDKHISPDSDTPNDAIRPTR